MWLKASVFTCAILAWVGAISGGQQGCCTPEQWQGELVQSVGAFDVQRKTGSASEINYTAGYDFKNKVVALKGPGIVLGINYNFTAHVIQDYGKGVQYTIDDAKSTCTKTTIPTTMPDRCINPNVGTFLGTKMVAGNVAADSWVVKASSGIRSRLTVTSDSACVPVTQVTYAPLPTNVVLTMFEYYNVKTGITDPSMFVPPSYCKTKKSNKTKKTRPTRELHEVNANYWTSLHHAVQAISQFGERDEK